MLTTDQKIGGFCFVPLCMFDTYECTLYTYNNKQTQKGSFMSNEIDDMVSSTVSNPHQTIEVIDQYEKKLQQNIDTKSLKSLQERSIPIFTQEEEAYLKKHAVPPPDKEVTIEAEKVAETFVIIKNGVKVAFPTELFKRMQELCPEKGALQSKLQDIHDSINPEEFQKHYSPQPTVNKNAYEIRTDILVMALDWVKHKNSLLSTPTQLDSSEDTILSVAQKFYRFVENKR